jgi:hypothetical protein
MMQSRAIRCIFAINRSFCKLRIVATPQFRMDRSCYTLNPLKQRQLPSIIGTHIIHIRKLNFSTTISDDEMKRRLDTFQDLYVVARDCMEDLVQAQGNDETDDEDDDENDEFFQRVAFVQDSVEAAVKEFNNLLNDLNDNDEQKNRIMRGHGFKVKQLELELAMLLQNTNLNDDGDLGDKGENDSDEGGDDDLDDEEEGEDEEDQDDRGK